MIHLHDEVFTTREAAKILKVSPYTLRNWKSKGIGPELVKVGGRIMYSETALENFINNKNKGGE